MLQRTDFYPTRDDFVPDMFPRREPVVHRSGPGRECGPLDRRQLEAFEQDGFLWFEGFFPEQAVTPFLEELRTMARRQDVTDLEQVVMDEERQSIRSVFAMHELSAAFDRMTRDPRLLDMVRQILGSEVYIHQSRINSKSGFCGNGFEWHSDFETWHSEDGMPGMRAVSVSIMLTENNPFNGPLMLIPGSHHQFVPCVGQTPERNWNGSLKHQRVGLPSRSDVEALTDGRGIHAPTGPAGSLLLFECNTLHASNRNMSPWPRANLFFVYNSVDNRLAQPFAGTSPRPAYLAARTNQKALIDSRP
ncbi:ectoine hydroxylase [Marinobacter sp. OP 3.4]|uniref:ectoine hydroxylase n=1 Tax=Marinobacter sp. OP 3.4 TaxID=3076501 RepID=UPI002E1F2F39